MYVAHRQTGTLDIYMENLPFASDHICPLLSLQPCYERVKDWLNENLVVLWIFALCTALTQVTTAPFTAFACLAISSVLLQMVALLWRKPQRAGLSTAPLQWSVILCAPAI